MLKLLYAEEMLTIFDVHMFSIKSSTMNIILKYNTCFQTQQSELHAMILLRFLQ